MVHADRSIRRQAALRIMSAFTGHKPDVFHTHPTNVHFPRCSRKHRTHLHRRRQTQRHPQARRPLQRHLLPLPQQMATPQRRRSRQVLHRRSRSRRGSCNRRRRQSPGAPAVRRTIGTMAAGRPQRCPLLSECSGVSMQHPAGKLCASCTEHADCHSQQRTTSCDASVSAGQQQCTCLDLICCTGRGRAVGGGGCSAAARRYRAGAARAARHRRRPGVGHRGRAAALGGHISSA